MEILYYFKYDDLRSKVINDSNLLYCDGIIVPIKYLTDKEKYQIDFELVYKIEKKFNKDIYLLLDKMVLSKDEVYLTLVIASLMKSKYKIIFSDFYYLNKAREYNCLDKMIYFSPTLLRSKEEVSTLLSFKIDNVILSYLDEITMKDILSSYGPLGILVYYYPQLFVSKRKLSKANLELNPSLDIKHFDFNSLKEESREEELIYFEDDQFALYSSKLSFNLSFIKENQDKIKYLIIDSYLDDDKDIVKKIKEGL